jgi:hypothetical protein
MARRKKKRIGCTDRHKAIYMNRKIQSKTNCRGKERKIEREREKKKRESDGLIYNIFIATYTGRFLCAGPPLVHYSVELPSKDTDL